MSDVRYITHGYTARWARPSARDQVTCNTLNTILPSMLTSGEWYLPHTFPDQTLRSLYHFAQPGKSHDRRWTQNYTRKRRNTRFAKTFLRWPNTRPPKRALSKEWQTKFNNAQPTQRIYAQSERYVNLFTLFYHNTLASATPTAAVMWLCASQHCAQD